MPHILKVKALLAKLADASDALSTYEAKAPYVSFSGDVATKAAALESAIDDATGSLDDSWSDLAAELV